MSTPTPPTITYTYRIYHFTNGLNESVWRAKRKGFLGLFYWMRESWVHDSIIKQRQSREDLMLMLHGDASQRRASLSAAKRSKLSDKLTLVVIEEDVKL